MRKSIILVAVLILVLASIGYCYKEKLEVEVWHWRHGNSIRVGSYRIPVPVNWYAKTEGDQILLVYSQGRDPISGKRTLKANARVSTLPLQATDLGYWKSQRQNAFHSGGLSKTEEYSTVIDREAIVCLGGNVLNDVMKIRSSDVFSMECRSSGNLALVYVGPHDELNQFYSLVMQIRHE